MTNTRTFQRSFAGGEVSPEMFGRIDDTHFQAGAAKMRNFIVRPQGPAQNRPGFKFVRQAKATSTPTDGLNPVRLIPFTYSVKDTLTIELGELPTPYNSTINAVTTSYYSYFRFHTSSGTILTDPPAWVATVTVENQQVAKHYDLGDLVSVTANGQTVHYYCIVSHDANNGVNKPTDVTGANYWYPLNMLTVGGNPYGILEFPALYKREDDFWTIHYVQSGDVLTLVHPLYKPIELRRKAATWWTFNNITFEPPIIAPTNITLTATPGQRYYIQSLGQHPSPPPNGLFTTTVASIDLAVGDYLTFVNAGLSYLNSRTWVLNTISNNRDQFTIRDYDGGALYSPSFTVTFTNGTTDVNWTGHTLIDGTPVKFTTTGALPTVATGTFTAGTTYYVRNSNPGANKFSIADTVNGTAKSFTSAGTPTTSITIGQVGTVTRTSVTTDMQQTYKITAVDANGVESKPSNAVTVNNNLYVNGAYNTLSWTVNDNKAVRYNIYKLQTGLYGYIGQTSTVAFTDDNIAPDMGTSAPEIDNSLSGTNNYPGAVSYFEQRRCFAGTINAPQNIWMTRTNTESDMSYGIPIKDTDRIAFKVSAREANTIRHIVPLNQLVLLTNAAEWRVTSVNSDALTPSSVAVRPQSYIGANNVQPCVVNNALVYCANRGGHVRELGYNWQAQSYITGDLSIRAGHLFDGYSIKDMAYAKAPNPILWFVSSTGKLLGLTYIPEEQVGAWHQHDTGNGDAIESCACVSEGEEDRLYVVVKRTVNNSVVRYIECMAPMAYDSIANSNFLDSSLSTTFGNPVTTVSGLTHLIGRTVGVLADGKVQTQKVVSNTGTITLDSAATVVTVGLPIEADIQTLPVTMQIDGFGQGRFKNVNKAWLRVYRSAGIKVGPDASSLVKTDPYTTTPSLVSDEIYVLLTPNWATSGQVYIRQSDPLPLIVVGLTLEVSIGG